VPTAVGLTPLPETVSFTDAAALGLAGATAHGIIEGAALEPGHTALVIGATGGVGYQVVQLAAAAGARVIATGAHRRRTRAGHPARRPRDGRPHR
jgi:NADPH:quinone reductase